VTVHTIAATTHGRYLVEPTGFEPIGLLVGFHGQSETAAVELEHLRAIRAHRPWTLVSVQGLHRYYTRKRDVVAAWMTREDRELALPAHRVNRAILDAVTARCRARVRGCLAGTAMAYRTTRSPAAARDATLASDVPPDVLPAVAAAARPSALAAEAWIPRRSASAPQSAGCAIGTCSTAMRAPPKFAPAGRFLDEDPRRTAD
jgi:hypothetical protein